MDDLADKLKKIAVIAFRRTPVLFAYLYSGGAPRRPAVRDGNIGIYVEKLGPGECLDLELSLQMLVNKEIDHPVFIEVRVVTHLPLAVRAKILTGGILIYTRDEGKRVEFERHLREIYFHLLPSIRQFQDDCRSKKL